MKHLRFRVTIFSCWLIAFYSIDRLVDSIDLSNLAYIFVLTMVVTILFSSRLIRIPMWATITFPTSIFLIFKAFTASLLTNTLIGITVIEVSAIIVTGLLTSWVSKAIFDFERAVVKLIIGHRDPMPETDSAGQGFIYREVRRARNHQRPLALLSVSVDENSIKSSADRVLREVQLSMTRQYVLTGVSRLLCDQLEDCAIIVQNNDRFLIALPETKPEEVPVIIKRLHKQVSENVGVELEIGVATLPKDSLTFEGLIEKATREMRTNLKSSAIVDIDRNPSDNPMTVTK